MRLGAAVARDTTPSSRVHHPSRPAPETPPPPPPPPLPRCRELCAGYTYRASRAKTRAAEVRRGKRKETGNGGGEVMRQFVAGVKTRLGAAAAATAGPLLFGMQPDLHGARRRHCAPLSVARAQSPRTHGSRAHMHAARRTPPPRATSRRALISRCSSSSS